MFYNTLEATHRLQPFRVLGNVFNIFCLRSDSPNESTNSEGCLWVKFLSGGWAAENSRAFFLTISAAGKRRWLLSNRSTTFSRKKKFVTSLFKCFIVSCPKSSVVRVLIDFSEQFAPPRSLEKFGKLLPSLPICFSINLLSSVKCKQFQT